MARTSKSLATGIGFLDDRRCQDSRHNDLLPGFQIVSRAVAVGRANGLRQFARSQVGCPLQILPRQRPHAVPPLGGIQFRTRRGKRWSRAGRRVSPSAGVAETLLRTILAGCADCCARATAGKRSTGSTTKAKTTRSPRTSETTWKRRKVFSRKCFWGGY